MSDETAKPAAPPAKTPKLLIALAVLNLGATGFITFRTLTVAPAAAATHAEEKAPTTSEVTGPIHPLTPFVVNLDEPGQARYVKVTMQVELKAKSVASALTKNEQPIRDSILSYLSGLHLADTQGVAAKDKLRAEVLTRLEQIVGPNKIRRVFFQEFVVQ